MGSWGVGPWQRPCWALIPGSQSPTPASPASYRGGASAGQGSQQLGMGPSGLPRDGDSHWRTPRAPTPQTALQICSRVAPMGDPTERRVRSAGHRAALLSCSHSWPGATRLLSCRCTSAWQSWRHRDPPSPPCFSACPKRGAAQGSARADVPHSWALPSPPAPFSQSTFPFPLCRRGAPYLQPGPASHLRDAPSRGGPRAAQPRAAGRGSALLSAALSSHRKEPGLSASCLGGRKWETGPGPAPGSAVGQRKGAAV